ncbi:MAG: hypothetical protein WBF66_06625 [Dehalococcoidia bacterium]
MDEREWDEGTDEEESWELEPTDPSHPDYDLSEAAPYAGLERRSRLLPLARWLIWVISLLLLLALVVPALLRIF